MGQDYRVVRAGLSFFFQEVTAKRHGHFIGAGDRTGGVRLNLNSLGIVCIVVQRDVALSGRIHALETACLAPPFQVVPRRDVDSTPNTKTPLITMHGPKDCSLLGDRAVIRRPEHSMENAKDRCVWSDP